MEFGYKMRMLRKAKDYKLRPFAKAIGKSPSYISNIERGVVPPPSAEVVKQIAIELDADVNELLQLANRFDNESIEKIRENAGKLESAEKAIKFLTSAIGLEDNDPLGGFSGILEIITSEKLLNPNSKNSFNTIRFIMDLMSKPDEGSHREEIQLRREIGQSVYEFMGDVAHPNQNADPDSKKNMDETIFEIFKNYSRELVEEIIKREELRTAYHEAIKKE
ncbi:MAG: helix-turn-helix domain-containing protein [Candidatus Sabulitectum sp.]|nr:helix-turn-helix domain-containing protein [Candidatus Sabulitectum sp.]